MWNVLRIFFFLIFSVCSGVLQTVTGTRGEKIHIRCSYEPGYESYTKYFCKGTCSVPGLKNIMVESGSPASDKRFSLSDNTTAGVFTVTITDLRPEDGGLYWCAVRRSITDLYSEIMLLIKLDDPVGPSDLKTTVVSTIIILRSTPPLFLTSSDPDPPSTGAAHVSTDPASHSQPIIYVSVGFVVVVMFFLLAVVVFLRHSKSRKPPSGCPELVSGGPLPLRPGAESTAEEIAMDDHNYQEISELRCKNQEINPIYSTEESPDDSRIYSTVDNPDSLIYSMADAPHVPVICSNGEKPEISTIYSVVN